MSGLELPIQLSREHYSRQKKALPLLNDGGSIIFTGSVASVKGDGDAALGGGSLSIEALLGPVDAINFRPGRCSMIGRREQCHSE
jgi:hypothetical protein